MTQAKNNIAIALLAYNRPETLNRVLESVLAQRVNGCDVFRDFDLFVSQDGLSSRNSHTDAMSHAQVGLILDQLPPQVTRYRHADNLGIARHYCVFHAMADTIPC